MTFSQELKQSIAHLHLLNHPFYQSWMNGTLSLATLQKYAKQYYSHVEAFPRYISATHSKCDDLQKRKVLLENLADEEGLNAVDHPELWLRFAEGLGIPRQELIQSPSSTAIQSVIETFMSHAYSSYHEGLSALYAYEYQVPEVAKSKIEGLKENYNINDEKSLSFFEVHMEADKFHRQACETLIDEFSENEKKQALEASQKAAQSLWNFLSSLQEDHSAA